MGRFLPVVTVPDLAVAVLPLVLSWQAACQSITPAPH
jgi:hypothetical protein